MVKEGEGVDFFLQIHNVRRGGYWLKVAIFKILATRGGYRAEAWRGLYTYNLCTTPRSAGGWRLFDRQKGLAVGGCIFAMRSCFC